MLAGLFSMRMDNTFLLFRTAPLEENLPALFGFAGHLVRRLFFCAQTVHPRLRSFTLSRFPHQRLLATLDRESNGKQTWTLRATNVSIRRGHRVGNARHEWAALLTIPLTKPHPSGNPSEFPADFIGFLVKPEPPWVTINDCLMANFAADK